VNDWWYVSFLDSNANVLEILDLERLNYENNFEFNFMIKKERKELND